MLTERRLMIGLMVVIVAATLVNWIDGRRRDDRLHSTQVSACSRGNAIRLELNTRGSENRLIVSVIEGSLQAAIEQALHHQPPDAEAAGKYQAELRSLQKTRFRNIALVDCGGL